MNSRAAMAAEGAAPRLGRRAAMAIGAAVFTVLQLAWSFGHAYAGWKGAWVMKTGTGIVIAFMLFLLTGLFVTAWRHQPADLLRRVGCVTLGAMGAIAVLLMIVGPGNLWPMVLIFNGGIVGVATLMGGAVGAALGAARSG